MGPFDGVGTPHPCRGYPNRYRDRYRNRHSAKSANQPGDAQGLSLSRRFHTRGDKSHPECTRCLLRVLRALRGETDASYTTKNTKCTKRGKNTSSVLWNHARSDDKEGVISGRTTISIPISIAIEMEPEPLRTRSFDGGRGTPVPGLSKSLSGSLSKSTFREIGKPARRRAGSLPRITSHEHEPRSLSTDHGLHGRHKHMLPVVGEFPDGFANVLEGQVVVFFLEGWKSRIPEPDQLLDGAHVDVAVVKKRLEFRHV